MNQFDINEIWLFVRATILGTIGSCIACWVQRKELENWTSRFFFFLTGSVCACVCTPAVIHYGNFEEPYHPAISFILGVVSATIITEALRTIRRVKWGAIIERISDRLLGKGNKNDS
jgi:uncharacterized membrane protein YeaQ/YmgE (transglycosylase-associated protein family)